MVVDVAAAEEAERVELPMGVPLIVGPCDDCTEVGVSDRRGVDAAAPSPPGTAGAANDAAFVNDDVRGGGAWGPAADDGSGASE